MLEIMAKEFSFDVVSDFDHQEVVNAVDQSKKEIDSRYDFKGTGTTVTLEKESLTVATDSELHLKAARDVIESKFFRRGLDLRVLDWQSVEPAAKGTVRQTAALKRGISEELTRTISKYLRSDHPKVHVQIQGDQLRVSSKDKDTLQAAIKGLKEAEYGIPLQFTNYR